jgi:hypothetical protein
MLKKITFAVALCTLFTARLAQADNVEIYLKDMQDNIQSGYCLDIAKAQGAKANPEDGLQGHTCYSPLGELMVDQIFDTDKFEDGILYMPEFDVCVQVASAEAGAAVGLAACDGSENQSFEFSGDGTIVPSGTPDLCVTVAEDTRTGRSKENQMKALSLETCSDDQAGSQQWSVRSSL